MHYTTSICSIGEPIFLCESWEFSTTSSLVWQLARSPSVTGKDAISRVNLQLSLLLRFVPSFKIFWYLLQTVRIWKGSEEGSYDCRHILKDHTTEVTAIIYFILFLEWVGGARVGWGEISASNKLSTLFRYSLHFFLETFNGREHNLSNDTQRC